MKQKIINEKKLVFMLVLVVMASLFRVETVQAKDNPWPNGPSDVSAEGAVVMDLKSGMILYNKNMDEKKYPASITKIMTTMLALENSSLSETVTYSRDAVLGLEYGASNMQLQPGEKITMEQSLYGVMLPSANEACLGVAEHISGSVKEFVKLMNQKAASLGCTGTHFANPNGLWMKNHYTTPHDMALIMRAAMQNQTFRTICNTKRYDIPKTNKTKTVRNLANHHAMVYSVTYPQYDYKYCIGGKTGYTSKSGATLVTCAKKGNMELVCVVMKTKSAVQGAPNIYTDTMKLFNYCFEHFKQHDLGDNASAQLSEDSLFTKFSPFYATATSGLEIDGGGSVILPKGVNLAAATKKVEYYQTPQVVNGKNAIGKITYSYKDREAGGGAILYSRNDSQTLNDSIDMTKWFEQAVEEANTPAFPWRTVALLLILAAAVAAVSTLIIYRAREHQTRTRGRRHYRRAHGKDKDFFIRR